MRLWGRIESHAVIPRPGRLEKRTRRSELEPKAYVFGSANGTYQSNIQMAWETLSRWPTLVMHEESSADVPMAINRCMLESAVNVTYLLAVDTPQVYDEFVKKGLGPERE